MSNIHQNDELLRVQDQNYDIVFNYDKHENGGVAVHAEKDGKNHKVNPEYARAALVKKIGESSGWPSDLPKPGLGGYGYTTTEVLNEVELTCERLEVDKCWSDEVEYPEELIIGESYEVTINGVTGTYECFDDDGDPSLGYSYDILESGEPGKWCIYTYTEDDITYIQAGMNLHLGETATFVISSIEINVQNNKSDINTVWSDEVEYPEELIIGESYEVTINGVTGSYECFYDDGRPTLGYSYDILESGEPGVWGIYSFEEEYITYICANINLHRGETATFVVKRMTNEDHRIDAKYLPAGYPYITESVILEDDIVIENGKCVLADSIDMGEFDQYDIVWDDNIYENVSHGYADDGEIYGNEFPYAESEYPFGILPAIGTIKGWPDGEHHIKISGIHIETIDPILLGIPVRSGSGPDSVIESVGAEASGSASHAEGDYTRATEYASHAEGASTQATGPESHAEGYYTLASGFTSHAEGNRTRATGDKSHAEGDATQATESSSHAEGYGTQASGSASHAEGYYTQATGDKSHAEGYYTIAKGTASHVEGKFNLEDTNKYAHIIGNGTSNSKRHNCFMVDWDGAIYVQASDDATKMMKITVASDGTITATQVTA